MHTILETSPTLIFLTIGICSFIFTCGSFILGHDHDAGGHLHDIHAGDHEYSTVSLYSPKVLALFGLAFGAGGAISSIYGLDILISTIIGVASGLGLAAIAYFVLNLLYGQQVNSLITDEGIVGCTGQVITRIPPDGYGEVTFISKGLSMTQLASSVLHTELKVGTRVKIISVGGNSIHVQELTA